MGSCAAPSAKGDDKFITTDYLQQCRLECYQRFQARASTATETSVKPDACDSPPSG
ncbi:DUF3330 domain-containing protein [Salmonella enterica]|uniref:DUF3330 domain-containing protein n=1 Tax=Enterobacteriaceae TaxID=543 RepID=UPI000940D8D8|nr:DUF3330 domain-containing protein [Escherichia coli]MCQ3268763.1 DUF3330 domain-containing protein [Salmonella enterica subsp. enterica serovar Indiana]MCY4908659.1 DUF3330 domain-containing protein [Salmonella enterica subsp. enterica serovar 1,4,[5],12:i:-]MCY5247166.1 DUF3330 domain-containing protein [Salmonella enterica subsp. enterica serovar 1,4,[5],12:i:-]WBZ78064.1 DUF3330 domain-containing protein [Escherichia coli]